MTIEASFVRSAASAGDLPRDGLREIALVGRSNVGKSSLINALVRQRIARTSAAPGKTRLANVYRVARGSGEPFYLIDLPGFGYAKGGSNEFAALAAGYFGAGTHRSAKASRSKDSGTRGFSGETSALFLVDARHPGLENDIEAWHWLTSTVERVAIVATKIDKLTRGERIRALREFESVFDRPVLPVSVRTGEGLDDLWKLIALQLTSA